LEEKHSITHKYDLSRRHFHSTPIFLDQEAGLALIGSLVAFFFAIIFAIMMVLLPLSFILWFICSIVAVWDLRKRVAHEQAEILSTKMAEKMRQAHPAAEPPPISEPKPIP
jgi:hypothetical protein